MRYTNISAIVLDGRSNTVNAVPGVPLDLRIRITLTRPSLPLHHEVYTKPAHKLWRLAFVGVLASQPC